MAIGRFVILAVSVSVGANALAQAPVAHALPPVPAQPGKNEPSALLAGIVKDLASDDVLLRLDAERRLIDAATIRLKDIEAAMRTIPINLEQRRRLLAAAYGRFCNEPRAGMGVQSGMDIAQRGLVLQSVVPGFPSAEVLRAGDRVLSVDGQAISDINLMRPVVIARDPGDEVPVVLVRDGTTLNVKVRLGRFNDLNQRDRIQVTSDVLEEAWKFRSASILAALTQNDPAPIESGLAPAAWQVTNDGAMDVDDGGDPNLDPRVRMDTRRLQNPEPGEAGIVAAGEARGAGAQIRWASRQGVAPTVRFAPGADGQVLIGPNLGPNAVRDARAEQAKARQIEILQLRDQQKQLRAAVERFRAELPNADAARKKVLNDGIDKMQQLIEQFEQRINPMRVIDP